MGAVIENIEPEEAENVQGIGESMQRFANWVLGELRLRSCHNG